MGTEASARLVIILGLVFTLCQLGSEFKYQSIAQALPYEERSAFYQIASELGLKFFGDQIESICSERSYGTTCDCGFRNNTICHITEIALIGSGLTGVIPKELANLTHLESLNLKKNQLTGSIPASLGNLSLLLSLDLSDNQLTGYIPESLGNLKFKTKEKRYSGYAASCDRKGFPPCHQGNLGRKGDNPGYAASCDRKGFPPCHYSRSRRLSLTLDLSSNQLSGPIPATLGNLADRSAKADNVTVDLYVDLSDNQLTGPIPESLGNLSFVRYLNLRDNFLNGSIPASLGRMTSLVDLILTNNGISGALPQTLGNLTNLQTFSVGYNSINGTLPKEFGSLTSLNGFSVAGNNLSGPFPDFIANWTSIYSLYLNGNNFHGKIPPGVFNLLWLNILAISDVGADSHFQFPPSTNVSFRILILRNCSINGSIPSYIGNMSSLLNLDLSFNSLTGRIPDSLKKLNLSHMSFSNNNLSGEMPDWIQNASWTKMDLSYNNFSKPFKTLSKLDLNLFSCCCNSSTCLPNTTDPTMENYCPRKKPNYHSLFINCGGGETINSVDGNIYDQDNDTLQFYLSPKGNWARSSAGNTVDLDYASNTSQFLKAVRCGLSSEAVLYNNARTSPVSLKYYGFCLRKGKYSVTLHFAEIVDDDNDYKSTDKRVFDVYIQGERKLKDFNIIDKAGGPNNVYQENFTAVSVNDSTLEIHFYSVGKGLHQGPLISAISVTPEYKLRKPSSPLHIALITVSSIIVFVLLFLLFAWMMGWLGADHLKEIDIGLEKPVTLKQLKDATRNFSKRNEIGKGAFGTVYKAEVQGRIVAVKRLSSHSEERMSSHSEERISSHSEERINQLKNEFYALNSMSQENLVQLLDVYNAKGLHLLIYEYMQNNSLAHALFEYKLRKPSSPLHIALITVSSIIVFVLLFLLFAWMMGWLGADHLKEIDIGLEKPVTLKQLKDATRNFSKRNEIGKGAFGTVYKAEVQGRIVAVKRLSSHSEERMSSHSEERISSHSEERINQLKNEFYALKSMSQENLVQLLDVYNAKGLHLLIYEYMQNNSLAHALFDSKSNLKLDWKARFNICLGIARGLVYLHEHPRLKMVHRDIKSANILLDGNLKAKISDFGLASLYTEDDQFKFIKVEVKEGYMAPEYVRGVVTSKADVYSFGVVILETVSGRKNAGHKRDSQETEFLLDTACDLQRKGKLVDLVDKTLSNKYDAKQAIIILNLAVKCINISPTLRPTMSEVVSVLVGDKKIEDICSSAQIEDINDPHVKEIAEFAVSEYNKKSGKKLELQSVVKGETQVVPGENYRLVIAVKDNSVAVKYEGVVYERIWEHTKELLSFNSHIAQVDSSVSMEVTSKASTSSILIKGEY